MFGRFVIGTRALRAAIIAVVVARIGLAAGVASADAAEAKKIFTTRCMACHTFGKGVKVGPDLKGVTERRQRPWLLKFIRSSSAVIASGDDTASKLFVEFKQQRMPDWTDLSEDQVTSILDWLSTNGPDQQETDQRLAESATLAEIENGRKLFHGERAFASGGTACVSCHSIRDTNGAVGGSLAPDLTDTYSAYQDGAVTQFLKHPCFARQPESSSTPFLTAEESFFLKGYLRQTVLANRSDKAPAAAGMVAKTVDERTRVAGGGAPDGSAGGAGARPRGIDAQGPGGGATSPGSAAAAPVGTKRVAWAPKARDVGALTPRHSAHNGTLLFLAFPYIALLLFIVGLGIRHMMLRRRMDAIRPDASAAWRRFSGSALWRIGIAVTVILRLVTIVAPGATLSWNSVPLRLYLLEGTGFLFGALALVGWVQLMRRYIGRDNDPSRTSASELADGVLLSAFGLAIVSGLVIATTYRWSSSWGAATVSPYIASLFSGDPATELVEQLPFLVRIHVLSWFAVIAFIPVTSAALFIVSAAHRSLLVIGRPFEAAARSGRQALAKLSPARWLWPEEDAVVGERDNAQEPS